MPREILTSVKASEILGQEKLRSISAVTEQCHSEIVYEILAAESLKLTCDYCGKGAKYIQHTIDHKGQNFMAITCKKCAPKGYEILSIERSA